MKYVYENIVQILFVVIFLFCIFSLLAFLLLERIRIVLRLKLRAERKERRKDIIKKFLAMKKARKAKRKELKIKNKKDPASLYRFRKRLDEQRLNEP